MSQKSEDENMKRELFIAICYFLCSLYHGGGGAKKGGFNFTGLMHPLGVITIVVFKHERMFNNRFCMSAYSIFMTHAVDRRTSEFRYALSL